MNGDIEHKTTSISEDRFHPLEVEWNLHNGHYKVMNGGFVQQSRHQITLAYPGNKFHDRSRIINLSPQTALNLLSWLEQERDMLELRAKEEQEHEQATN